MKRLTGSWIPGAVMLAALAYARPASAQELELIPYRIPGWTFTPSLSAGLLFDTNVALADERADTGETQGDSIYLLTPSGQLEFLGKRTDFSAGYQGHLRRYDDFSQLDGFDQRFTGSLRQLISKRVTLSVRDSYMDVPTTDETELNGVLFSRTGSRTNRFSSGVDVRLNKFTTATGTFELTFVDFDRDDLLLNGGWLREFTGGLSRQMSARFKVGADYTIRFADLQEDTRHLTFQDGGASMSYQVGANTQFTASGGISHLEDKTRNETHTGPYIRLGIAHNVDVATLGMDFERSFVPSFGFGGSSENQQVHGYVHLPFTKSRTYVQGSVTWRRSDPFDPQILRLDSIWFRTTVGYSVVRWLRTEGFYNFARQDSVVTGGEVNRHRLGVQVVISQPMRIQ